MDQFFESNPGFRSRIAHHVHFPDFADAELLNIVEKLAASGRVPPERRCRRVALREYIVQRRQQPNFANARSIRNAFDRSRLRQAMRLVDIGAEISADDLITIEAADIRGSSVFTATCAKELHVMQCADACGASVRLGGRFAARGAVAANRTMCWPTHALRYRSSLPQALSRAANWARRASEHGAWGSRRKNSTCAPTTCSSKDCAACPLPRSPPRRWRNLSSSTLNGSIAGRRRSAGWVVKYRHQRLRRHDLFGSARAPTEGSRCDADAFLQTGVRQVAAGYAIYGPQTAFVLTVGAGTHVFTLDRKSATFHLTAPTCAGARDHAGVRDQRIEPSLLG